MQAVINHNTLPSIKLTRGALGLAWLIDSSKGIINSAISQLLSIILLPVTIFVLLPFLFYLNYLFGRVDKIDFQAIIKDQDRFKSVMSHYHNLKNNRDLTFLLTKISYNYFPIGTWVAVSQFRQIFVHLLTYTDKLGKAVSTIDQIPKDDLFQHIDNDNLWKNRTKSYDYLA
ncbi:MAG: hypothetical protein AB8G86_21035 [Saprospiraceae bacterium]